MTIRTARHRIQMMTAYDSTSARLAEAAGTDLLLVGDSVATTMLGREHTTDVTMEEMLHHCRAVTRMSRRAFVVADMPFGSYTSPDLAVANGVRLIKEGGADAVKIEGPGCAQARALVGAGVPVCGHIGFTPQTHGQLGGYRVQGKTPDAAARLIDEAKKMEAAGCFALVLELMPSDVAREITKRADVPTLGIGTGERRATDGDVHVWHDVLGLTPSPPQHARAHADVASVALKALKSAMAST